jgi:hypothetical protein
LLNSRSELGGREDIGRNTALQQGGMQARSAHRTQWTAAPETVLLPSAARAQDQPCAPAPEPGAGPRSRRASGRRGDSAGVPEASPQSSGTSHVGLVVWRLCRAGARGTAATQPDQASGPRSCVSGAACRAWVILRSAPGRLRRTCLPRCRAGIPLPHQAGSGRRGQGSLRRSPGSRRPSGPAWWLQPQRAERCPRAIMQELNKRIQIFIAVV